MTKEEMGDVLEPFYQYVGRQSDDEEWVKLRDLVYELVGKLERPKGEWRTSRVHGGIVKCDFCGFDWGSNEGRKFNYCPHCGADMRGEE